MNNKMNGAAAFFKNVQLNGVDTVFACPGTSEMQVIDELGYSDLSAALCIHENTVTAAADGYYRMARKPALALLHVACGLTNGIANLHNARKAGSSMVIFGGGVHVAHEVNNSEHAMLKRPPEIAGIAAEWVYEARTPDELAQAGTSSVHAASTPGGRICYVYGPNNAVWGETTLRTELPAELVKPFRVTQETIDTIAAPIKAGKKVAFILGGEATLEQNVDILGRIISENDCKLFIPWTNAHTARGAGRPLMEVIQPSPQDAVKQLEGIDEMVIVAGQIPVTAFSYYGEPWSLVPEGMSCNTLVPTNGDVTAALNDLAEAIGAPAKATKLVERASVEAPTGPLTGASIDQSIVALLPDHSIIVDESLVEGFLHVSNTHGAAPHVRLNADPGGAIGGGLPLGIGAAIACPDRKVVVLTGDFSMMQIVTALWTIANQDLDICVVCYDNGGSSALEGELARVRKGEAQKKSLDMVKLWEPEMDYAVIAEGHKVPATVANTAEEFHAQFAEALSTKGPRFINAKVTSIAPMVIEKYRARWAELQK